MILKEVTISGFRSFFTSQTLKIERDVTVLIGPNDVGKSSILRMIQAFHDKDMVTPEDLNVEMESASSDPEISKNAAASFDFGTEGEEFPGKPLLPTSARQGTYGVEFKFLDGSYTAYTRHRDRRVRIRQEVDLQVLPSVILCDLDTEISSIVNVEDPNDNERRFLQVAFGMNYADTLGQARDESFPRLRRGVERDLTKKLAQALSSTQGLEFQLSVLPGDPLRLSVEISDETGTTTGLSDRGSGYRKLITLLVYLFDSGFNEKQVIVLLDEPENSLHADSQHALRYYLERVASHENIQVVYATHSSSMINPVRPRCVRLVTRDELDDGQVSTIVDNDPYKDGNFQLVRGSLGMSPADSLLYGAITVIVEGDTEVLALSHILERLSDISNEERPEDLEIVLGQIHIVGAGGFGNVHKCATFALSQGSHPIAFVDGDEFQQVEKQIAGRQQTKDKVQVIHLPPGGKFEALVLQRTYFKALSEFIAPAENVSERSLSNWYETWEKDHHKIAKLSSRIDKWIETEFSNQPYRKDKVMRRAVELAAIKELMAPAIIELIDAIRKAAATL